MVKSFEKSDEIQEMKKNKLIKNKKMQETFCVITSATSFIINFFHYR